jgi:hypothetical protein
MYFWVSIHFGPATLLVMAWLFGLALVVSYA